jgi:hypothetical protein
MKPQRLFSPETLPTMRDVAVATGMTYSQVRYSVNAVMVGGAT